MWQIKNPSKVYSKFYQSGDNEFELICIIPLKKYNSFPVETIKRINKIQNESFTINDIEVDDPDNLKNKINCKLIKLIIK